MNKTIFQTTILGTSGAMPTSDRHNTAQVLKYSNKLFLLDCSEGAQMQMRRLNLPLMKINKVFISHLHGDHYLGLPGLLFTYHLLGREKDLYIYSPPGLENIIRMQLEISNMKLSYNIIFTGINKDKELIYEDESLKVETIEMLHSIPAYGFLFIEKPAERKIKKHYVKKYNIPVESILKIKKGSDYVTAGGDIISNKQLTIDPPKPRVYAFCSDTAYTESFIDRIKGIDLLYHEATFMQDFSEMANKKYHTTTVGAARVAKTAGVQKLLLGHYSARYDDDQLKDYLREARSVFNNTVLAEEGEKYEVG